MVRKTISLGYLKRLKVCPQALVAFEEFFGEKATIKQVVDKLHELEKDNPCYYGRWEAWILCQKSDLTLSLIKNGANIKVNNNEPVYFAVLWNQPEIFLIFLYYGAEFDVKKERIFYLAKKHFPEILKVLEEWEKK